MKRYRLIESATRDIDGIQAYVAAEDLTAAGRLLNRFVAAFEKLAVQPGMGHARPDLTDEPIRFWSVGSYLILYAPVEDGIEVLRVLHGARNVWAILNEEENPS